MLTKIRSLREAQGLSQETLADRAGISTSQVSRYESGKASLMHPGAERLAAALGLRTAASLLGESSPLIQVIGEVGAGAEIIPLDDGLEWIEGPPGLKSGVAFRVVGTSMMPVYKPGDILFAEQLSRVPGDVVNRDCVVQVEDGPRLVKRLHRGSRQGLFRLFSYETQEISDDLPITAASPVIWIKRE